MKALGTHILAELSGCDNDLLINEERIREIITKAAVLANAEVREVATHRFSPQGVSGVVVIAESHLSIHTWPEYEYAAIDIYTCGDTTKPENACSYISRTLKAKKVKTTIIERGIEGEKGVFEQKIKQQEF